MAMFRDIRICTGVGSEDTNWKIEKVGNNKSGEVFQSCGQALEFN